MVTGCQVTVRWYFWLTCFEHILMVPGLNPLAKQLPSALKFWLDISSAQINQVLNYAWIVWLLLKWSTHMQVARTNCVEARVFPTGQKHILKLYQGLEFRSPSFTLVHNYLSYELYNYTVPLSYSFQRLVSSYCHFMGHIPMNSRYNPIFTMNQPSLAVACHIDLRLISISAGQFGDVGIITITGNI